MKIPEFKIGMSATLQKKITEKEAAFDYGMGVLKSLLDTPSTVKLVIQAASKMIDPLLPEGLVSIGKGINVIHLEPVPVGITVTVEVTLKEVDKNRLLFEFVVYDELSEVARGHHERYIVSEDIIKNKAKDRLENLSGFNI
ncbi:thioesterase family protein [Thermovenabulum sp.]|uniref:thioesterase family protein n=1 Tax=Thermovenabulum sp. TaxID=3100335 RepID=UPI003C799DC4